MIGVSVITIDGESVHTRNVSRALFACPVTIENLDPTSKNPIIANFFTRMGRSEEPGSGTRSFYKFSRLYTGEDTVLEGGDQFAAIVPASPVMVGAAESERGYDAATSVDRSGAVVGLRRNRTRTKVEIVVNDLLASSDSFAATEVGERVAKVSDRTVRRHLAEMVKEGKLISGPCDRSTIYRAGSSADSLGGDC